MYSPKALVDGVLIAAAGNPFYTADAVTILTSASFCNDHSAGVTLTVNLVPSGGTAGAGNQINKTKTLQAGESWICPGLSGAVLEIGDFISLTPSVDSKIGCRISGSKVS